MEWIKVLWRLCSRWLVVTLVLTAVWLGLIVWWMAQCGTLQLLAIVLAVSIVSSVLGWLILD